MHLTDRTNFMADRQPRYAVGIGASAGGLEALEVFFKNTPEIDNCAFFVVTHLSPDFKSLLDELLRRHTSMTVEIAEHGKEIRAACVYIIPPKVEMVIATGRIFLKDRDRAIVQPLPIDVFFHSLALEYGASAIAVILSGTGSDGTAAIRRVSDHGGLIIAQDPEDAKFDGMPKAAIASGVVEKVASAAEIGRLIAARTSNASDPELPEIVPRDRRAHELNRILEVIHGVSNVDFSQYKKNTVYRRILRRMVACECETLQDYTTILSAENEEQRLLANDLLIGVTEFFRDRAAFTLLREKVIAPLIEAASEKRSLRIWIPGCATGEEAYSVAALLYLEARKQGKSIDPQIFATDLSHQSIDTAARGIYSRSKLSGLDSEVLERCFEKFEGDFEGDLVRITPEIRRWIVFSRHNFMADPPFTRMDLISCRNALIYLEAEAQQRVLALFNFGLRHGGTLFLGPSETIGTQSEDFETIDQRWRIFKKSGSVAASHQTLMRPRQIGQRSFAQVQEAPRNAAKTTRGSMAYIDLLDHLIQEGILISQGREVLHVFGSSGQFLLPPSGQMSTDVLEMVVPEIRVALSTAVDKATIDKKTVEFQKIRGANGTELSIRVTPLLRDGSGETKNLLLEIRDLSSSTGETRAEHAADPIIVEGETFAAERFEALQRELDSSKDNLQSTIEEVETSNEELQSTNEELMAANEELQSTNEELQSVNEELYTVNAEYQRKNDELVDLTHQIENLMAATNIGVVFVDDRLKLKRFTKAATEIVNFIAQDIGRSLDHITHSLLDTDLPTMVIKSLRARHPTSAERRSTDGRWWEIRINPMRAAKGRSDGAVIMFYDISKVKQVESVLVARSNETRILGELLGARALSFTPQFEFATAQEAWTSETAQAAEDSLGRGWLNAIVEEDRARVEQELDAAIEGNATCLECLFRVADGSDDRGLRHIRMISRREDRSSSDAVWSSVLIDLDSTVQSDHAVRESEQALKALLRSTPGAFVYLNRELVVQHANDQWLKMHDLRHEDVFGVALEALLNAKQFAHHKPHMLRALGGDPVEHRSRIPLPDSPLFATSYEPDRDETGSIVGVVMRAQDLSGFANELEQSATAETLIGRGFSKAAIPFAIVSVESLRPTFMSSMMAEFTGYTAFALSEIGLPALFTDWESDDISEAFLTAQKKQEGFTRPSHIVDRAGRRIPVQVQIISDPTDRDQALLIVTDLQPVARIETVLQANTTDLATINRMFEIFVAGASHEMKAPLRKIRKYSEILVEDYSDRLGQEGAEVLGVIYRSSEEMRETVDSIFEMSRLERDRLDADDVALDQIVENIVVDNSTLIELKNAKLDISPLPNVRGDRRILEILFGNLLRNALVHSDPTRHPEISIFEVDPDDEDQIEIAVSDNGPGIGPALHTKIFEPFFSSGSEVHRSGMGLALCKSAATKHGGRVTLQASTSEGSRFVVTLPRRHHQAGRGRTERAISA